MVGTMANALPGLKPRIKYPEIRIRCGPLHPEVIHHEPTLLHRSLSDQLNRLDLDTTKFSVLRESILGVH